VSESGAKTTREGVVEAGALRDAAYTGVRWSSATRLAAELLTFAGSVVLARLVSPAEFGSAIVAIGIAAVVPVVIGAGYGVPLVQMPSVGRARLEAAFLLSVVTGAGATLATIFVVAPFLVEPVFGGRIAYLLQLVSPTFTLAGLGTVPNALLQRGLRFRRLSEIEIISIVTSPVVSISLAATTDLGAEAVILGGVATAAVATVATVASAVPPVPRWHRLAGREILPAGFFASLAALTAALSRNIHYAILGARFAAQDVGLFWRGYQLAVDYQVKVGTITVRIAFPVLSRSGGLEGMRRVRSRILQVQSTVLFPLLAILIVLAPEIVPLVYGEDWQDAAYAAQVLAVAGMATIAASVGGPLAFAAGKSRELVGFNLVQLAGFVAVVAAVSSAGLRAVVVAIAVYQVVAAAAQFAYLEGRVVGIPLRDNWKALAPASVASAVTVVVAYPAVRLLSPEVDDLVLIFGGGALCLSIYALVLRVGFPQSWIAVRAFVRRLFLRQPDASGTSAGSPADVARIPPAR
jgi:O-antigen/teichoic acid export membrane protein